MAAEYELNILDYVSIMRRRAPYLIGIFVAVFLISIIYALTVPRTYRATGTIMAESQQVSENIGAIKSQLDDQVNAIIQRMMTRENLLGFAKKYKLFPGDISSLTSSEIVDRMRNLIDIEKGGDDFAINTSHRNSNAISFTISFEDRSPEVALHATNDLIALFLDLAAKLQTEGAAETTDFLSQQSKKLKTTVDDLEQKIAKYKHEHSNALPEQMTMRMSILDRTQNDLLEVEREFRSTQDDIRSLEADLDAANQGLGQENVPQTLPALKAEYARLSAVYNESYPDVRELKRKIQALEKPSNTPASGVAAVRIPLSPTAYRIQSKIDADNAKLISLDKQRESLRSKIAANEAAMAQAPDVEQGLSILIRDRDAAQKKYEEIKNSQMNAQIAQNLVSGDKGGRFSVLEPPVLPDRPKSKRMKIVGLGFILAIVSSVGGVVVLESVNKRVRGSEELTHVLGKRPLVVIPFMPIQQDEDPRKYMQYLKAFNAYIASLKQKLWWVVDLKRKLWG
jgi:succinoglycan biosynthesis transport protein ExoP